MPESEEPQNSEVSEQFLKKFSASPSAIRDFEKALERDGEGNFIPFEYEKLKGNFTLADLAWLFCPIFNLKNVIAFNFCVLTSISEPRYWKKRACLAFANAILWRPNLLPKKSRPFPKNTEHNC